MASEEVMVAQNQGIGQKITQVAILLQTQKEAVITAINLAIPAAINLVELIKHRVKGLYQVNTFEKVQDSNKTRLKIRLSFEPLDSADKGYQAPIPFDQVQEKTLDELKKAPVRTSDDNRPATGRPYRRSRGRGQSSYEGRGRGQSTFEGRDQSTLEGRGQSTYEGRGQSTYEGRGRGRGRGQSTYEGRGQSTFEGRDQNSDQLKKDSEDNQFDYARRSRRGRGDNARRGGFRSRGPRVTFDRDESDDRRGGRGRGDRRPGGDRRGRGWVDRRPRGTRYQDGERNPEKHIEHSEPPSQIKGNDPWGDA